MKKQNIIVLIMAIVALASVITLGAVFFSEPIDPPETSTTSTTTTGKGLTSSTTVTTTTTANEGNSSTTTTTNNGNGSGTTTATTTTGSNDPVEDPNEIPNLDSFDSDELATFYALFDSKNHISIRLDISDGELKKIQQDYEKYSSMGSKSPIYRMADMYVTITKPNGQELEYVIKQVGVRMKGNTSRTSFYNDNDGMYNLIHFKVSFGETFDDAEYYGSDALVWTDDAARKERKNRTFATLEKIDMRWNKNDDPTYIRETYAYDFYRSCGVLAPHTTLASVDIGNDHAGVWTIYEPIDKIFLEKNLPESALGGDLYKLGWTNEGATFTSFSQYGVEDEDAGKFYIYDLKTNKKTSDHSSLKNLINTLNSSACTKTSFESLVDLDNFLSFCAASYMIGNPDDLRNNYNNCYIYFRADNGKMMIIPYDMDRGFGVNKDWNPFGDHMTTDSPFSAKTANGDQRSPLFNKSILSGGFFVDEYIEALKRVSSDSMLDPDEFAKRYEISKDLYSDDATPSKRYGNAWDHSFAFDISKSDGSNMSFKNYITAKQATLERYLNGSSSDNSGSGSTGGTTPEGEWNLYLRGNFYDNNWSNQEHYKFKHLGDGVYFVSISIEVAEGAVVKFKVYNNDNGAWYNTVDESCSDLFVYQGDHMNVQFVESGDYIIYFDINTLTIRIEKATAVN